jgi:DNA-binding NarL/FixJ family response regulator
VATTASPTSTSAAPSGATLRVLVGAGSFLLREGLARVLEREQDVELVGSVLTDAAAIEVVERCRPHAVIVTAALPPDYTDEGVRLAVRLRHEQPKIGVVLLGDVVRPADVLTLVADGVAGRAYLLTERIMRAADVLEAVRAVAAGGAVVDPAVMEGLAATPDEATPLSRLTARELDVLALIAEGDSNSAIAGRLGLSKRAVEKHISEIFARLDLPGGDDVSRRVAAALLYLRATGRLALSG